MRCATFGSIQASDLEGPSLEIGLMENSSLWLDEIFTCYSNTSYTCQKLWATLMYDTPSLVFLLACEEVNHYKMTTESWQAKSWTIPTIPQTWLLRADCMKFHFSVRTNLAKTWQNMTQMLLNVALLRAHVHLLQAQWLQSQNTGLHRSSNFLWCIYIRKIRSKCIQMWIQYHL